MRAAKARWARMIKKVYEVDPLTCPKCGAVMRILTVIEILLLFLDGIYT